MFNNLKEISLTVMTAIAALVAGLLGVVGFLIAIVFALLPTALVAMAIYWLGHYQLHWF